MRLTRKGKKCLLFVLVTILLTTIVAMNIGASASEESVQYISHIVEPNDTLWGIAEEYGTDGDIRKTIYDIKRLNQLDGSDLVVGTRILIAVS